MKKRKYVKLKIQKNLFTNELERIFKEKRKYVKKDFSYWEKTSQKKEKEFALYLVWIYLEKKINEQYRENS